MLCLLEKNQTMDNPIETTDGSIFVTKDMLGCSIETCISKLLDLQDGSPASDDATKVQTTLDYFLKIVDKKTIVSAVDKEREMAYISTDAKGRSRLQDAIVENKISEEQLIKMVDELGDNCFPGHTNSWGNTVLMVACMFKKPKVALKLI